MKKIGWIVLSYMAIYGIAVVFAIFRLSAAKENADGGVGVWEVLQLGIFPVLFFAAGYFGTSKYGFSKLKLRFVLLFAAIFGGLVWGLWYLSLDASVMCHLPVTQGCYALDHWMRKFNIVYKFEYTVLGKTDLYLYFVLPFTYFLADVFFWVCFFLGNIRCVSVNTKK